jgi:LuxR family maltose regulon positive regulatory protein
VGRGPLIQPRSSYLRHGTGTSPGGRTAAIPGPKSCQHDSAGRSRVLACSPSKRLAVIKAPAGFGKSSLAATWAETLEQDGNAVGCLTIDSDNDEDPRFLFYVTQALLQACPDVGAGTTGLIVENNLIAPTTILSSLINDLTEIEDDVYVLSDPLLRPARGGSAASKTRSVGTEHKCTDSRRVESSRA